ncbi:phage tail protein [bacterium]|nr:phage tail protein [bacterium]
MAITAGVIAGAAASLVVSSTAVAVAVGIGTALVMDYTIDAMEEAALEGMADTMGGRNVTTKNATAVRDIVYGTTRKGGTIVYQSVCGVNGLYPGNLQGDYDYVSRLNYIICFNHTTVDAITEIWLDDTLAWQLGYYRNQYASNGTSSATANNLKVQYRLGTSTQSGITFAHDSRWNNSNDAKLKSIAYAGITFIHDPELYTSGVPKVTAVIRGKKVYDPRSGQTVYSTNPVLCLRDYLTNSDYGAGLSSSHFDASQLEDAADFCDETITIGGVNKSRYSCNGVISTGDSVRTNIKKILSCMKGKMVFVNGTFRILPKRYTAPHATTLNEDMIIGDFIVSNKNPRQVAYNEVRGKFVSAEANYITMEYPPQRSATYESDDGDIYRKNLDLPLTIDIHQAQRLATLTLNDSRRERTIKTTINARGLDYAVGDTINVTNTALGITEQKYEITGLKINISDSSGITIDLEGRETNDTIDNQNGTYLDYIRGTSPLPNTSRIDDVNSFSADTVLYYENNIAYTGISTLWSKPYAVNVNYYRVGIGDPSKDFDTYKIYTTTETQLVVPNYDETANVRVGVQVVNDKGMRSSCNDNFDSFAKSAKKLVLIVSLPSKPATELYISMKPCIIGIRLSATYIPIFTKPNSIFFKTMLKACKAALA